MALNRPRKPSYDGGSFDDPNDKHYDLGLVRVTLHKVGDLRSESAVRMRIDSDRNSLLEPIETVSGKEPSAADKLIQLVKEAMRKTGMQIIEESDGAPGQPRPPGLPENRIKLSLRTFSSHKPGSDGVIIRAGQGRYNGEFNADTMMEEAGDALQQIAHNVRDIRTVEKFEAHIDEVYNSVDMYEKTLQQALKLALLPTAEEIEHRQGQKASPPEEQLAAAVGKRIPESLIAPGNREDVIHKVVKGVLCAGEACWVKDGAVRDKSDPLRDKIKEAIGSAKHEKPISDGVMDFLAGEVADAVYAFRDKQAGITGL